MKSVLALSAVVLLILQTRISDSLPVVEEDELGRWRRQGEGPGVIKICMRHIVE